MSSASRRVAFQPLAGSTDNRPMLQDLDVIAAVRGIRLGQATYVAETLDRNFWSDVSRDGILSVVLFLMD